MLSNKYLSRVLRRTELVEEEKSLNKRGRNRTNAVEISPSSMDLMKRSRQEKGPTGNPSLVTMIIMAGAEANNKICGTVEDCKRPRSDGLLLLILPGCSRLTKSQSKTIQSQTGDTHSSADEDDDLDPVMLKA